MSRSQPKTRQNISLLRVLIENFSDFFSILLLMRAFQHFCRWCKFGLPRYCKNIVSKYRRLVTFGVEKRSYTRGKKWLAVASIFETVKSRLQGCRYEKVAALNRYFYESITLKSIHKGESPKGRKCQPRKRIFEKKNTFKALTIIFFRTDCWV